MPVQFFWQYHEFLIISSLLALSLFELHVSVIIDLWEKIQ